MRRLLGVDPLTGTAQYVDYDENEDAFRYHQVVEADPITDFNRLLFNDAPQRWGDMQRVASLPMVLWLKLKRDGVLDDPKRLAAWLNDPDNAAFRTRPGRV